MTRIKVDGITNWEDARAAVEAGADAIGFIFAPSPRRVTPEQAREVILGLPPFVTTVGVFVDCHIRALWETVEASGVSVIQLHGAEPPEFLDELVPWRVIKAFRVREARDLKALPRYAKASALLLDAYVEGIAGGTGRTFDWSLAVRAKGVGKPIILAGGLTPDNVAEAVAAVQPYGVDVSSGVEAAPGRKDHDGIRRFIQAVRSVSRGL